MMNALDFEFVDRRGQATAVETTIKPAHRGCRKHGVPSPAATSPLTVNEGERFLAIVAKTSRITRHYELFQLLQSEEIQHFIPHQVLISAWGDFGGKNLKLDVISAIPGVRTGLLNRCPLRGLLKDLYQRWIDNGQQPLLLGSAMDLKRSHPECDCALHKSLQGVRSLLVHGVINARDGSYGLYLALSGKSMVNGHRVERFCLLAASLITQIDVAFRRIAALKSCDSSANQEHPSDLRALSARENEALLWLAEGKSNAEIGAILGISSFTVKNHIQQIFRKLEVSNRIEAVAKSRQMDLQSKQHITGTEAVPAAKNRDLVLA